MKLGIVSCYFINNYGSVLQAYATQEYFRSKGAQCDTISVENLKPYLAAKRKQYYLYSLHKPGLFLSKLPLLQLKALQKLNYKNLGRKYMERVDRFDGFRRRFILSKEAAGSLEELSAAAARYDAIVVGSDQLWRPDNIFPEYYTLSWVPDRIPKFSYATSFGVSRLDRYSKERAKSFLGRFTSISVRESSGHAIVEALTGKSVPIVCDPVFLLKKKEWEKISDASRCPKEQYIFTYFLGAGKECRRFAGKLSDRTGLPVVGIVQNDAYRASDEQIDCPIDGASPEEFLGLLSNAAYICTDSFHAAAFSTIFNKRFFVFNRFASKKHGTNSRIQSLLEMLGLEGRLMAGTDEAFTADINAMDYTEANEKLFAFVHRSEDFIESQILKGEAWDVTEKSFASQYDQEHRRNRVLSKKFI